jgi:flagellar protein FliJ
MKKFRFRLNPLLRLRKQQQDQKKRVVGELVRQIHQHQRQAVELAEAVRREGDLLREQYQRGHVDMDWIGHYYRFVTHTRQAIRGRIETVGRIQTQLQTARQDLAQAAQKTRILEKLKEKQYQRYQKEVNRLEILDLDEIGAHHAAHEAARASLLPRWVAAPSGA